MTTDPLVLFMPSGKRGRFPVGTPVLNAARSLGVYVESVCGGRGICGRCQVSPQFGAFAKHGITSSQGSLSPWSPKEIRYTDKRGSLGEGRRLACSALIDGPLVVDVPNDAVIAAPTIRKAADTRTITRDPTIRLAYVEVEQPDMHHPLGDLDRLKRALADEWGVERVRVLPHLLPRVQGILREGEWKVTAALHDDGDGTTLIALAPGLTTDAYGIACDIGSTTIAMHLSSLITGETLASSGIANPQIRFGEDLMSRVSYVMMNPDGQDAMTKAVRDAINGLLSTCCREADVAHKDVLDAVFVGNPIMHHLFLGIDPTELGQAPFALATSDAVSTDAPTIGLQANEGARVYVLPCIAGHVGADAAAATLAEAPHEAEDVTLLVDVGTNAEIVLGSRARTVAASSPTGPAFEGAEISCGQRAAPGAIERVRIDGDTLVPRYRVIGCDLWSDEDGFEKGVAEIGVTGLCGSAIIEVVAEMFLTGIIDADGVIDGALAARSPHIVANGRTFAYRLREGEPLIQVTQNDVRAIQLAKAALHAGVRLLMDKLGAERIERVLLAGAFGTFIDPKYALVLGLVPDCEVENVLSAGNAAGTGARMALLDRGSRRSVERLVREVEKIETAVEPRFQEHFVNAMAFPNKVERFDRLARTVALPEPREAKADAPRRRGGRRRAA